MWDCGSVSLKKKVKMVHPLTCLKLSTCSCVRTWGQVGKQMMCSLRSTGNRVCVLMWTAEHTLKGICFSNRKGVNIKYRSLKHSQNETNTQLSSFLYNWVTSYQHSWCCHWGSSHLHTCNENYRGSCDTFGCILPESRDLNIRRCLPHEHTPHSQIVININY